MVDNLSINKLFIDTAPFIYFIEEHKKYLTFIKPIFTKIDNFNIIATTSTITVIEVLVQPIKEGNKNLENKYLEILKHNANLEIIPIDINIAEKAAEIRSKYDIKTPDAIQIASAIVHNCDSFFTNDTKLKRVKEINIITLNDLAE